MMLIIPKFKIKCYLLQNLAESQRLHKLPSQKAKTFFATGRIIRKGEAMFIFLLFFYSVYTPDLGHRSKLVTSMVHQRMK